MGNPTVNPDGTTLDDFIEPFEEAHARGEAMDLAGFLPPAAHVLYLPVLRELVRVDLEYRWQRGNPLPLEGYQARFPELFQHRPSLLEITFEEYRLRQQAGEQVTLADYQRRFGIDPFAWPVPPAAAEELSGVARRYKELQQRSPKDKALALSAWLGPVVGQGASAQLFQDVHAADPKEAERLAAAMTSFPEPGTEFVGFQLLQELGRGAFGRVYLARQGELAGRLVALKVSARRFDEAQTLARLQHTNIVPIYSVHVAGPLQAVCMPYLGAATLADVVRALHQTDSLPQSGKELAHTVSARRRSTLRQNAEGSDGRLTLSALAKTQVATALPAAAVEAPLRRLEAMSYVTAVLRLGAQLADGLAHAHEHGVVHRDLKPANVLLTDDGQPMLLDFNLAADAVLRDSASAAVIGGTLPYMAPEHLDLFDKGQGTVDGRADIFALGVILYELLAGRLPFETSSGPLSSLLAQARAERHRPRVSLRSRNRDVTPAVEAIVHRCLEPDPDRRYRNARELEEDLKRHLDDLPLRHTPEPSRWERARKWYRRHPRLTVACVVGAVAAVLLLGTLGLHARERIRVAELEADQAREHERGARLEAANAVHRAIETRGRFRDEMRQAQLLVLDTSGACDAQRERACERCAAVLAAYHVLDNPNWADEPAVHLLPAEEQRRLREDVVELLLLWARATLGPGDPGGLPRQRVEEALRLNQRAEVCSPADTPRAVWQQRAALLFFLKDAAGAEQMKRKANETPTHSARDLALLASSEVQDGLFTQAQKHLEDAVRHEPQLITLWLDLAVCHERQAHFRDAAACYGTCTALAPTLAPLYLKRAIADLEQERYGSAEADLSQALLLKPDLADAHLYRALARAKGGRYPAAIADATQALKLGSPPVRTHLIRARLHELAGDSVAAEHDREKGFQLKPAGEACWLARGSARRLPDEAKAALADFEAALCCNERSLPALQNQASLLAGTLGQPHEAITVLDRLIELFPDYALAWSDRGVLRARQGDRAAAHRDAKAAMERDRQAAVIYRAACIYALTSAREAEDRLEAYRLLGDALRQHYGLEYVDTDHDLDAIRDTPEFRRLVEAARKRE